MKPRGLDSDIARASQVNWILIVERGNNQWTDVNDVGDGGQP